jgi:hypothetical protein
MTVRRQRRRDFEHWRPVFWSAVISGGMVALAFLATWYFN